jgi:hypothetical protein
MLDELTRPDIPAPLKVVFFTRDPDRVNRAAQMLKTRFGTIELL